MKIPIALIQFDAIPERVHENLGKMRHLTEKAVSLGARWVMFHEGTVCDYTPKLADFAELVPAGESTQRMKNLSHRLGCYISFGLSERSGERYYITQVFVSPEGFLYHYRKTWLWRELNDGGYRNEWARYDPGRGPELFLIDGVRATCFICADGEAPRCIERAAKLKPEVVFYPNNRAELPEFEVFSERAQAIKAAMLVTNRVGYSWDRECKGGSVIYSVKGDVLAKANREGKEEILVHTLDL